MSWCDPIPDYEHVFGPELLAGFSLTLVSLVLVLPIPVGAIGARLGVATHLRRPAVLGVAAKL